MNEMANNAALAIATNAAVSDRARGVP